MSNNCILYLGGFCLPNCNAAAQRVVANAKLLRKIGYEVFLIGMSKDTSNVMCQFEYEGLRCVNIIYPKTYIQWIEYLTSIKKYKDFIEKINPKYIIAYNHPAIALEKLIRFAKKNGITTISDCTEWYEPQGGWLFRKIKGWDVKRRMYNVHCEMNGLIVISKYLNDFYTKRGVKTLQLPPLVDKQERKWVSSAVTNNDSVNLLFAGSIGMGNKDRIDYIIDGLCGLGKDKRISFDVVGITEQQFRSVYNGWAERTIPPFVHFHGRLPHEEVISLLCQSDFQIFIRENNLANTAGFPTKFVETISARTLVLTNSSSNLKDYMQEGVNCYELDISSKEALVKSLWKPLSMTKQEIQEKKGYIDSDIFDYRRYANQMKTFIESL